MKIRTLLLSLSLAAIAAISLTAAACGGDDDNSSSSNDTSSNSDTKLNSGTGGDEQYVSALCKAAAKMQDSITKVDASKIKSADDAVNAMTGPIEQFVKDLKAAKPPKDVQDYHNAVVKKMSDAVDALKKNKDPNAFGADFGEIPTPTAAVKDRLQKIVDQNEDCKKADFTLD